MKRSSSRSLDDLLPLVFIAFTLLAGATLWHEAAAPTHASETTRA